MIDSKIFEYLRALPEWRELGESFKEIYAEKSRDEIEDITQEDMDQIVCEELWDLAIALVSKLAYEKLQRDIDIQYYKSNPVSDLKKLLH